MNRSFIVKSKKHFTDKRDGLEKTRWVSLGRAFINFNPNDNTTVDSVAIELDATPFDGSLRAFPAIPRAEVDAVNDR